jgi:hypothetical protein
MSEIAYKAFDSNWKCRDFQYEVGATYQHEGPVKMCESGFHACEVPFDCWNYYPGSTHLARVELGGVSEERRDDSKRVAAYITISASLTLPEWIIEQARVIVELCKSALSTASTGYGSHAASTGDGSHAASTGDRSHAASTGYRSHAAVKGRDAIAASLGKYGTAQAEVGGAIVLAAYDADGHLVAIRASKVGENDIEPGKTYRLTLEGEFEEVA